MEYVEDSYVELTNGLRGLVVEVRLDEQTRYDIELPNGEITTVFADEVVKEVHLPTK
ncbi:hypothetical protein [Sporosarcina cyprini]|uniref:hypothetical protein n=1 Tax=Sporosarcina cyprini TaxID=2910523 RepID=UPI001EE07D91|nr:hypothetical protein [Sporosarcina cyprini]MCG3087059.1 hypothetical protein [Sporosarcina cyprini]